ncbi:MAG: sporulation protein [Planctomycetia bacterium]|nr:sporulation protein [Planctomycetia bacterium]
MGFLQTVKNWLNIGGVSVKLQGVNPRISRSGRSLDGRVVLTSKGEKLVLSLTYRLIMKVTKKKHDADEKEETQHTLSEIVHDEQFEMTTGETKTIPFSLPYVFEERLQDRGGFLGTLGKLGAFANDEKEEYFLTALCDVKGTALDPMARVDLVLVD